MRLARRAMLGPQMARHQPQRVASTAASSAKPSIGSMSGMTSNGSTK
jgi:hypothetical protein